MGDRGIRMKNEDTTTQEKTQNNYDNGTIWMTELVWGAIKKAAMQDNYESQVWFDDLYSDGKDRVRACREAQIKQGDDGPLLIKPDIKYIYFVWPDGVIPY